MVVVVVVVVEVLIVFLPNMKTLKEKHTRLARASVVVNRFL